MSIRKARRLLAAGGAVKAARQFFTGSGSGLETALSVLKNYNRTAAKLRGEADLPSTPATEAFIEQKLRPYLTEQHGTEGDPLPSLVSDDPEGQPSHAIMTSPHDKSMLDLNPQVWGESYQPTIQQTLHYLRGLEPAEIEKLSLPDAVQAAKAAQKPAPVDMGEPEEEVEAHAEGGEVGDPLRQRAERLRYQIASKGVR